MNDSITVVATKTRTAGRLLSIEVLIFQVRTASTIQIIDDSTAVRLERAMLFAFMKSLLTFYNFFMEFLALFYVRTDRLRCATRKSRDGVLDPHRDGHSRVLSAILMGDE